MSTETKCVRIDIAAGSHTSVAGMIASAVQIGHGYAIVTIHMPDGRKVELSCLDTAQRTSPSYASREIQ